MRSALVLVCCLAIATLVRAEQPDSKHKKKGGDEQVVQQQQPQLKGKGKGHALGNAQLQNHNAQLQTHKNLGKAPFRSNVPAVQSQPNKKGWNKQKFQNFHAQQNSSIASVKFKGTGHIEGSEKWEGKHYEAF